MLQAVRAGAPPAECPELRMHRTGGEAPTHRDEPWWCPAEQSKMLQSILPPKNSPIPSSDNEVT